MSAYEELFSEDDLTDLGVKPTQYLKKTKAQSSEDGKEPPPKVYIDQEVSQCVIKLLLRNSSN